jgi:hypothetical protein
VKSRALRTHLRALAAGAGVAAVLFAVTAAESAPTNGGAASITDAGGAALASGGSQTAFNLKLPASPADRCSADSATGNTNVYGYIVPSATDPASLTFNPDDGPSSGFPLYKIDGTPDNAQNTGPGTGQVVAAQFNFDKFSTDGSGNTKFTLPVGTYNIGVACWKSTTASLDKYWNTTITFVASNSDPNKETWTAAASTGTTTTVAGVTTTTVAGATTTTVHSGSTTTTVSGGSTTTTTAASGSTTSTTRASTVSGNSTTATTIDPSLARSGRSFGPQILLAGVLVYLGALVLAANRRHHWASKLLASRR